MAPKLAQFFTRKKRKITAGLSCASPPHEEPQPPPRVPRRQPTPPHVAEVDWDEIEEENEAEARPNSAETPYAAASDSEDEMEVDLEKEKKFPEVQIASKEIADNLMVFDEMVGQERYHFLSQKKFEQTRYLDLSVLTTLGIADEFFALTSKAGFKPEFWNITEPVYTRLTMEFLCTIKKEFDQSHGIHYVQFNLQGKAHTVSEFELAEHMHFEPNGNVTDLFVANNLWKLVTGRTLGKNTTKLSSHLQHSTIRFIQRALSFSIFARGESRARVTKEEMALLTQMLQPIGTEHLNLPFLMIEHWMAAAKNKKMGAGQYTLGGYITHLAKCLGHKSFQMKKSEGPTTLDIKMLDEMKHVKKVGRNYFWVYDARMFDLPFEKKLDLNDPKTFILVARGGTMLHHDGEQLRQRFEQAEAAAYGGGAGTSDAPQQGGSSSSFQPQGDHQFELNEIRDLLHDIHNAQWRTEQYISDVDHRCSQATMKIQQLRERQDMEFQAAEAHRQWERTQMEEMRRRQVDEIAAQQLFRRREEARGKRVDTLYAWWESRYMPPQDPPQQ